MEDELKSTTPNSPTDHLQIKVALLDDLVKSLRDTIKEQFKHTLFAREAKANSRR